MGFELSKLYYTYIIKSLKDNGYYFGHCENINIRIQAHNSGKVKSTKSRIPVVLHYLETFPSKSLAFKRDQFFKTFEGRIWLIQNKIIESSK